MANTVWNQQIVLITGAGHGLGRTLSTTLSQRGARVVVTDIDFEKAKETCDIVERAGGTAWAFQMDVTDLSSVNRVKDEVCQTVGNISLLVNNAGFVRGGGFQKICLSDHLKMIDVNLKGLIQVTHCFLPELLKNSNSSVVNISSASAMLALPFASTYAASKWGVLGFTESLREELKLEKQTQLHVMAVCPSYISTGMFQGVKLPWLMQWISPESLATRILRGIEKKEDNILTPWNVVPVPMARGLLPRSWFLTVCRWLGVSQSMATWEGHSSH